MSKTVKMKALQTIPTRPGRKSVPRGKDFEATLQEARDLWPARAEYVNAKDNPLYVADATEPTAAKTPLKGASDK